jgi:hypothetical protein
MRNRSVENNESELHMNRGLRVAIISFATLALMSTPLVSQAVVPVDPGAKVSLGKTIIGTGQNLPTLNSSSPWDIGSEAKEQVIAYYTDGAVARDRRALMTSASAWTRTWLKDTCGSVKPAAIKECKAAAVFDIDDTLFSSYSVSSTNTPAFSYNPARSTAAETACELPTIKATKNLLKNFQSWGMDIFLITGRFETERAGTIKCLNAAGISGWKQLTLKQPDDKRPSSIYKANVRKNIEASGVKIGPSLGDQISDMSYGYLGRGFLMPNLMYFLP